jgi:hypothetical protein
LAALIVFQSPFDGLHKQGRYRLAFKVIGHLESPLKAANSLATLFFSFESLPIPVNNAAFIIQRF